MKLNNEGINLILKYEGGYRLKSYKCPAGVWTIGAGSTFYQDGKKVQAGDTITQEDAVDLFLDTLSEFEAGVRKLLQVQLNNNQFSAIVSFAFNCGLGNLKRSTLLKKVHAKDFAGAAEEFDKWTKSKGKILNGLVYRRAAERSLFDR